MSRSSPLSKLAQAFRFWRTVRHLKVVQIVGRLRFKLARPRIDQSPAPAVSQACAQWHDPACREPSLWGPTSFRFLNEERELDQHGWDDPGLGKLWRYNQHYFDDLNAKGSAERTQWQRGLMGRWIAENPPPAGSGWEPYPTSLRIVNWIKWALSGQTLSADAVHSLAVQSRWLMKRLEWHLLGNHLFANAKALVFAGMFFEGEEAAEWQSTGEAILRRQVPEQILADGAQFERSPMYHALALEDMLDLINVARAFGEDGLADQWTTRIPAMSGWLAAMSHPDGRIAFFNDAAHGIAPDNSELSDYAERLGFASAKAGGGAQHFAASGYVRLSSGPAVVMADLAPIGPDYLPGHAHADTLSFELSVAGERAIVNSGTSVYGLGPERERQRGTAAHSALLVDGTNSSEVWSGFRVGRRAVCSDVEVHTADGSLVAMASHNGFAHLPGNPIHHRKWQLGDESLIITDTVSGQGEHEVEAYFHLAAGLTAERREEGVWAISDHTGQVQMAMRADGAETDAVLVSSHPQFGVSVEAQAIRARFNGLLPHIMRFTFSWSPQCDC